MPVANAHPRRLVLALGQDFSRSVVKKAITGLDLRGVKEKKKRQAQRDWSQYRLEITPEFLASKTRTRPIALPPPLMARFHGVFSKYQRLDIYNKGNAYMKLYSIMHASERPTNLFKLNVPFQNTSDLQNDLPALKFQLAPRKDKELDRPEGPNDPHTVEKQDERVVLLNYDQNMVIAYMFRKYPESYNIMNRMLHEISLKYPDYKPKTLLDFGAGLSPSGTCFLDRFPEAEQVFAVERNIYMRKMGRHLTKDRPQFVWAESLQETAYLGPEHRFDITVCSFVLEEVSSAAERKRIVEEMMEKTVHGGFSLFVLPGSPMGFRFLNDIREMVRAESREDFNIIAPCPHHERCPLASTGDNWCRFEQDWPRFPKSVVPKMPSEYMTIRSKFCYLIVRKGPKAVGATEAGLASLDWDRIVRPVKRKGGHSIVYLCNRKGQLESRVVAKSHERKFGFKESKKLKWGDLWKFPLRLPNKLREEAKEFLKKEEERAAGRQKRPKVPMKPFKKRGKTSTQTLIK